MHNITKLFDDIFFHGCGLVTIIIVLSQNLIKYNEVFLISIGVTLQTDGLIGHFELFEILIWGQIVWLWFKVHNDDKQYTNQNNNDET